MSRNCEETKVEELLALALGSAIFASPKLPIRSLIPAFWRTLLPANRTGSLSPLQLFASKPDDHAGSNAKIILMIIYAVVETCQVIVGFKGSQGNPPGYPDVESASGNHRECISWSR